MAISFVGARLCGGSSTPSGPRVSASRSASSTPFGKAWEAVRWTGFGPAVEQPVPDGDPGLAPDRLLHGDPVLGHQVGSVELQEAARIDGATEWQAFRRVAFPSSSSTVMVVWTTVVITVWKMFDIVFVMTGGREGTQVVAQTMVREFFTNHNNGIGATLAVVLFIAVVPISCSIQTVPGRGGDAMTTATEILPPSIAPCEHRHAGLRAPIYLVIGVIALLWTIPAFGLLVSSFRESRSIRAAGWWNLFSTDGGWWDLDDSRPPLRRHDVDPAELPDRPRPGFSNAFANSLAVTIPAVVIPITIAAFAAYAFAWMGFPGRNVLFVVVVGLMVVPLQMALIPILRIYTRLQVNGTFPAIWLAHAGFGLPLAVYLLRNYMGSLPSSIIESAMIDGADHFTIFRRLVVPLSVPVLASFAIFQFLWVWNDYLVALIFLGNNPKVQG